MENTNYGSDTDTEDQSWFQIPIPNFGLTLLYILYLVSRKFLIFNLKVMVFYKITIAPICELRRFIASHARTFAHSIFGRTHIARTCAFCQNSNRTRTRTCAFVRVRFIKIRTRTFAVNKYLLPLTT